MQGEQQLNTAPAHARRRWSGGMLFEGRPRLRRAVAAVAVVKPACTQQGRWAGAQQFMIKGGRSCERGAVPFAASVSAHLHKVIWSQQGAPAQPPALIAAPERCWCHSQSFTLRLARTENKTQPFGLFATTRPLTGSNPAQHMPLTRH